MIIGAGEGETFLASDVPALLKEQVREILSALDVEVQ